jgi:hypothetical protein
MESNSYLHCAVNSSCCHLPLASTSSDCRSAVFLEHIPLFLFGRKWRHDHFQNRRRRRCGSFSYIPLGILLVIHFQNSNSASLDCWLHKGTGVPAIRRHRNITLTTDIPSGLEPVFLTSTNLRSYLTEHLSHKPSVFPFTAMFLFWTVFIDWAHFQWRLLATILSHKAILLEM